MAKAYNKALCSQAVFAVNEIIEHQRHAFVYVQPESAR